jgi:uncharacterized protein
VAVAGAVVQRAMGRSSTLADVVAQLGFVQADPIRAPARAQDLILRHRVDGYRAGDLERHYPALDLDEDYVYAYGFVPSATRALLHPRPGRRPAGVALRVLSFIAEHGPTHPRLLLSEFGNRRVINAWGGQSHSTTRLLEDLHFRGHLRVARREKGIRVYEAVAPSSESIGPDERLRRLILKVSALFGPLPDASLKAIVAQLRYSMPGVPGRLRAVQRLHDAGQLVRGDVGGVSYTWTADGGLPASGDADGDRRVRFLAPFDPIVWDRRRFEHLWGWPYRFEAYTPIGKRQFGYYALPMLWGSRVIGWANVSQRNGVVDVAPGFVDRRPRDREFSRAFDEETSRVEAFLSPGA